MGFYNSLSQIAARMCFFMSVKAASILIAASLGCQATAVQV